MVGGLLVAVLENQDMNQRNKFDGSTNCSSASQLFSHCLNGQGFMKLFLHQNNQPKVSESTVPSPRSDELEVHREQHLRLCGRDRVHQRYAFEKIS